MGKLLKKNGKLVKKNGRLVRTDNPANCDCCGGDPPPPEPLGWFCDIATCMECYSKEDAAADADLFECPSDVPIYGSEQECKDAGCPPLPPGVVWTCLTSGGCEKCYNDEAPGVPPNTTGEPNCSSLPPHSGSYGSESDCDISCNKDVVCWQCGSGGICFPVTYNTPGGVCPPDAYPTEDLCKASCGGGNPLP